MAEAATVRSLKPPLKWAGGKRWLLPELVDVWNGHASRRLVEPFCGGLAVTIGLQPRDALLNDVNPHLINFYRWLRRGLSSTVTMMNSRRTFYANRDRFNELLGHGEHETAEAAALFYYLNRTGYNGLCRFNRSGRFNVPFGRYRAIAYASDFSDYSRAFRNWEFTIADFEQAPLRPDDFVYADPPYDVQFTQYSKGGFGWDDQVRAAEWLAQHKGPVVVSNQATDRIVALYRNLGFSLQFLKGRRLISSSGDRTPALEVLATKNV
jgi:DNA adenine methylase